MCNSEGKDKWTWRALGGAGSSNKINYNLAKEQRFCCCNSLILGLHSWRKFLTPIFFFSFWWRGDMKAVFSGLPVKRSWLQELEHITAINIFHTGRTGKWKDYCCSPGKPLMWKKTFCAGAESSLEVQRVSSTQWAWKGSFSKEKQGESVICRKHF